MNDDTLSGFIPEDDSELPGDDSELDELIAHYVDRYNLGEDLDPESILSEHPRLGAQLLEQLHAFLGVDWSAETRESLHELGDFQLVRQLGRGGMGVVYEAREAGLDRRVAVKVLPQGAAVDGTMLARFRREARAAAKLHHPNVVTVYGMGVASRIPYYSMLTGQSPRTSLRS